MNICLIEKRNKCMEKSLVQNKLSSQTSSNANLSSNISMAQEENQSNTAFDEIVD